MESNTGEFLDDMPEELSFRPSLEVQRPLTEEREQELEHADDPTPESESNATDQETSPNCPTTPSQTQPPSPREPDLDTGEHPTERAERPRRTIRSPSRFQDHYSVCPKVFYT